MSYSAFKKKLKVERLKGNVEEFRITPKEPLPQGDAFVAWDTFNDSGLQATLPINWEISFPEP